ncbi:MAG: hypothetical protein ACI9EW_002141 [Cellvibrionaceae bacterium]|jgi:uncharacterized protein (TIGR02172 family)
MEYKNLGQPVAIGRTADIHKWEEGTVVKLYQDWFQLESIQNEAGRTRELSSLDFPIPQVGEVVQVNDRNGLILEHIHGKNMLELVKADPSLMPDFAKRLAQLHVRLHQLDAQPNIAPQSEKLARNIRDARPLSDHLKTILLGMLDQMPEASCVCHGDFHPGNVIVTAEGEVVVDWNDASIGSSVGDVARSTILFLGGITGNEAPDPVFETTVRQFHKQYLNYYFDLRPEGKDDYERWLPIIAGARLCENITALEPWLLAEAEKAI